MVDTKKLSTRFRLRLAGWQNKKRISRLAHQVAQQAEPDPETQPLIIFNASSRLTGLSLNASFSSLTAWSLRLAGVPVIHFVCQAGMKHCMLGTNRQDYTKPPPCDSCITQSRRLYTGANVHWFEYQEDPELAAVLEPLNIEELSTFEFPIYINHLASQPATISLGGLVLPSIRWALRRYTLPDDEQTRYLMRSYILSAFSIARQFASELDRTHPSAVVIFNGSIYPEATVGWVTKEMGIRTITHEVGFQHLSTFFTDGQATAYPIHIPIDFELSDEQNERLDEYLENRFQGKFTMAGIRFWPEMRGLDTAFLEKASHFKQVVPIFSNVVYDTSQVHASVIFPHMFVWLDLVLELIRSHPETLFVIRAHPDEMRSGTAKLANESVQDWVLQNKVDALSNTIFINPLEYVSSYELIHRSKFVIVYNSSIGLEAALLGKVVVCGGKARYNQIPTVYFPESQAGFRDQVEEFLAAENVTPAPEFQFNARRFLYYQLYRTSLPLNDYLETTPRQGFVKFRSFSWQKLLRKNSTSLRIIYDGIMKGEPFIMSERT